MTSITPSSLIPLAWVVHTIICFYLIRRFPVFLHRALLTTIPCIILIFLSCHNLPYYRMESVMTVSLYWMISIRLFHLIVFSPNEIYSFPSYVWKLVWFFLPIVPCQSKNSIGFYILSAIVKFFITHWIYQWLLICEPNDSYGRMGMFYINICVSTYIYDLQAALVQLVTRNKYSVLDFNNYPFLSKSVREFWGRRYNRLVGTLLKESVFDPVRRLQYSSAQIGAMACFIVSGLLHAHVATAAFGVSPFLPFMFFILHGLACCVEAMCPFTPPKLVGILLTHVFLLITGPLYIGLFTRVDPEFYEHNKPPLYDLAWFPKLPVPNFCPK